MKQTLFVVSGLAVGFLSALVALGSSKTDVLPRAEAIGNMIMGIGGAAPNQNDLCWVLIKGKSKQGDSDRYSLSLYKANNQGVFDLTDEREITYDGKLVQVNHPGHNKELTPAALKKKLDQSEHREGEENNRAPHPSNP
jgi:hypothetical protein